MALENLKSVFSSIHYIDYDAEKGGIHGGTTAVTPSQPPHSSEHSLFDNFQHRPGFGPGMWNDGQSNPSAFENMTAEEYSPILNLATGMGAYGEGMEIGGAPASLYPSVTVASHQQSFTVTSPIGFNTQVTGQIAFTRTPRVDENTLPVNFLTKGYSYTGMGNYSLSEPNEIAGFTKNFSTTQYSQAELPILGILSGLGQNVGYSGQTISTNFDGLYSPVEVASTQQSFAVTSPASAADPLNQVTGQIAFGRTPLAGGDNSDAHMNGLPFSMLEVNFLGGGQSAGGEFYNLSPGGNYSYLGLGNYSLGISSTIPGFTKNFNSYGYSEDSTPWGSSKFLNDGGIVIDSGLAPKTSDLAEYVVSSDYTDIQVGAVDYMHAGYSYYLMSNYVGTPSTIPGFTTNFDPIFPGGFSQDTPEGESKFLTITSGLSSLFAPRIRSTYSGDLTTWPFTSPDIDENTGLFSLGVTNSIPDKSYDTHGYDHRAAHGIPTTIYQGGIFSPNEYQGSMFDNENIPAGNLLVGNHPVVDRAVNFFGAGYSYSEMSNYSLDTPNTIDGFNTEFNPNFPGGWTAEAPYGVSKYQNAGVAIESGLSSLLAPRIRSTYSGDLTTWPFTATDANTGLFSLGVTDSTPDKSYDTHSYDPRVAHGIPTTIYQGGIFPPNLYQGSMFDDENIPAGNLLVGNHPVVDGAVNFFGAGYSYSTHPDYGTIVDFTIPEIDGFNTEFKPAFPGGWTAGAPWGSSKFLNNDGTAISSGWAPKGWSSTAVDSINYTNVVSNIVDYMEGGNYSYTYPGGSTLTPSTSPGIPGFTKNMTTTQFSTVSGLHPANWAAWMNSDAVQIGTPVDVKEGYTGTNISSYEINFFGAGHSYSTHPDYGAADDIPEIPGFTTRFDYQKGGWTTDLPWGQSKFLVMTEDDPPVTTGVAITSGWAPGTSNIVDYMQGGNYSYTYPTEASVTTSPEISGFTKNFDTLAALGGNITWGGSKFISDTADGTIIISGLAPKGWTGFEPVTTEWYSDVNSYTVNFMHGGAHVPTGETTGWSSYSYSTHADYNLTPLTSPGVLGFTANFDYEKGGWTTDLPWGQSKFLVMTEDDPPVTTGVAITSGWAPKSSNLAQYVASSDFEMLQAGIHPGPAKIADGETYGWLNNALGSLAFVPNMLDSVLFGTDDTTGGSWSTLYNSDHTAKGDVGYTYPNVSRDNLNIRYAGSGVSLKPTDRGEEPYIVTDIGSDQNKWTGRSIPLERALVDVDRILQFMYSDAGKLFIGKQNLLGSMVRDPEREYVQLNPEVQGAGILRGQLFPRPQRYGPFYDAGASTLASTAAHLVGQAVPNVLLRRDTLFPYLSTITGLYNTYTDYLDSQEYTDSQQLKFSRESAAAKDNAAAKEGLSETQNRKSKEEINSLRSVNRSVAASSVGRSASNSWKGQDVISTFPTLNKGKETDEHLHRLEGEKHGAPFYFKDLRDDNVIIFRGWIEGLSENISPSWTEENYIGRSESAFIYERATRDISFTLKLFAQTQVELRYIYKKLNRLSSLCYPEYKKDINLNSKTRMKPPLTKFRLGELFGNEHSELLGFIKSLSYTYDDNSPWETTQGRRVPKYVQASISYQVIHQEVPSLAFVTETGDAGAYQEHFYGINIPVKDGGVGVDAPAFRDR